MSIVSGGTVSSDQGHSPPGDIASEQDPTTKLLDLHVCIDAHTRDRDCCNCKERLILIGVRYECRTCREASLCKDCANCDPSPGLHSSTGQIIDLRRIIRSRSDHACFRNWFTEEEQASLEPTEENEKYLTHLLHQIGLREDFCRACLDVTPDNVNKYWQSRHEVRESDLKVAAEGGCITCSIAYRGLLSEVASSREAIFDKVTWHVRKEEIEVDMGVGGRYLFRANPGHMKPWDTLRYAPLQTASMGSEESFATIRSWIKACERGHPHEQCARQGDALLPRRLIYIDPHNVSDMQEPVLSLQEPPVGTVGKYIALSHCWGTEPVFGTTSKNFSQLCTRIDFSDLPLTFRDAIRCAQRLGITYVWIDSLCIIQDDLLDWEMESAKMASIYHDAYLVVAAGSATSAQGGLFYERPDLIRGRPLESKEGSGIFDLLVQQEVPHLDDIFPAAMKSSPINGRAWCMQELILARRSVSFFKEELIWECHSCLDCECGKITNLNPMSNTTNLHSYDMTGRITGPLNELFGWSFTIVHKQKPYSFFPSLESILNEWRHLTVSAYTRRRLSKPRDRLPAAAGIASLIAKRYNQEYLAGIWRADFKCGLMWSVPRSKGQHPEPAPDDYIAPSFSWASVDWLARYTGPVPTIHEGASGPEVNKKSAYGDIECELVEASVVPDGVNPLGCVKAGSYIRLKGLSLRFTLHFKDNSYSLSHHKETGRVRSPGGSLVFYPDCVLKEVNFEAAENYCRGPVKSVNRATRALALGISDEFEADVDALVLADVRELDGMWFSNCCAFIVLGLTQASGDSYERLGLGTWKFGDDELDGNWMDSTLCREVKII